MLALNRRLFLLDRYVRSERWIPVIPPPVGPLHGETLGMIGFGRIGRMMAKRGAALDMEMVAYDPFLPAEAFRELGRRTDLPRRPAAPLRLRLHP